MITIPPYLQKGDTIGIVAPAGYMAIEKMGTCIETLDAWGYNVELGDTTHSHSSNYFSGTDDERLADLQRMLDDKNIKAILCARGGYGTSRIIDRISFKKFRKRPKWIIGFSDITVLHAHLLRKYKTASMHAPMAAAFNDGGWNDPYVGSLRSALDGTPSRYSCTSHSLNREGACEGVLIGGNLSLLAHLIGTPSEPDPKKKILFLEDIGEHIYSIDRMMVQLKRCGWFDKLAGLVIGGFTDMKDTERPFGKPVEEVIYEHIAPYDFPVCFGFPVSHEKENVALKIGVAHSIEVKGDGVKLEER